MKAHYLGNQLSRLRLKLPLFLTRVQAGFPSPADDYMDKQLDLNEFLIKHEAATFYCRASGNSMEGSGIFSGDILIVDRSVKAQNGCIVIANIDGELTCKTLDITHKRLLSSNDDFPPIAIGDDCDICIEGVVIHSIRSHVCTG